MARKIKVVFDGKVFRPEEPVDLPANAEYHLAIDEAEIEKAMEDRPLMRYLDLAIDMGISDLAEQHDHYLYGTPKR